MARMRSAASIAFPRSRGLRLPIWRRAQLTAFFTMLRSSVAASAMSGRKASYRSSGAAGRLVAQAGHQRESGAADELRLGARPFGGLLEGERGVAKQVLAQLVAHVPGIHGVRPTVHLARSHPLHFLHQAGHDARFVNAGAPQPGGQRMAPAGLLGQAAEHGHGHAERSGPADAIARHAFHIGRVGAVPQDGDDRSGVHQIKDTEPAFRSRALQVKPVGGTGLGRRPRPLGQFHSGDPDPYTGTMRPVHVFNVVPSLPAPLEGLRPLAYNLRWAWDHNTIELFRRLDSDLWETTGHNPVRMLGLIDQEQLEAAAHDEAFLAHLDRTAPRSKPTWRRVHLVPAHLRTDGRPAGGLLLGRVRPHRVPVRFSPAAWACWPAIT